MLRIHAVDRKAKKQAPSILPARSDISIRRSFICLPKPQNRNDLHYMSLAHHKFKLLMSHANLLLLIALRLIKLQNDLSHK